MLDDPRRFIYAVDPADNIVFVNQDWLNFARDNDFYAVQRDAVIGDHLWHHVADPAVQHLYKTIFDRVRDGARLSDLAYRCDAPDCRRYMQMDICRLGGEMVRITSRIVREEFRDPVPLLSDFQDRSEDIVTICSFCKKVRMRADLWVEVETAIRRLGLAAAWPLPHLSHGICEACYADWEVQLDAV